MLCALYDRKEVMWNYTADELSFRPLFSRLREEMIPLGIISTRVMIVPINDRIQGESQVIKHYASGS